MLVRFSLMACIRRVKRHVDGANTCADQNSPDRHYFTGLKTAKNGDCAPGFGPNVQHKVLAVLHNGPGPLVIGSDIEGALRYLPGLMII